MRRRLLVVLAATAATLGSFGAVAAQAEPATVDTRNSDYWACVAVDAVEVGTCVENPLPDPSGLPSARQVVYDLTGVNI